MAQNKYDLLLVPSTENKKIRPQPWYKERLKTKYLKSRKSNDPSLNLIGKNWVFLKSGVDDFRDGRPCNVGESYVIQGDKGISPVISHSKQSSSSDSSKVKPRLTKDQQIYSKSLPMQEERRNYIDEIEYGLTQHPLALYPHLEEGMSSELFEEVVNILDPEMRPGTESEEVSLGASIVRDQDTEENTGSEEKPEIYFAKAEVHPNKAANPYKWILQKNSTQKDEKRGAKKRPTSPSQDEHIKKVTKEFCDWVAALGGTSNNVEESTIMSLFASGYETKPALSVPIHVVELTNVPMELKLAAGLSTRGSGKRSKPSSAITSTSSHELPSPAQSEGYTPSWVSDRKNYGAWYLDPKLWSRRAKEGPLIDPEEVKKKENSESKRRSAEMDSQLYQLHGARAFRNFLERSNRRKPDFMVRVSELQNEEEGVGNIPIDEKDSRRRGRSTSRNSGRTSAMTNQSVFDSFP